MENVLAIILGVIAVLGTLGGVVLGRLLDTGTEGRRWLRDHRAESYAAYVQNFQEMRQVLRRIAVLDRKGLAWSAARDARRGLWERYNFALVAVELYGSTNAYLAAAAVDVALRGLSDAVTGKRLSTARWHAVRLASDLAMREYIDIVRAEMRLDRHPSRQAWVEGAPGKVEDAP